MSVKKEAPSPTYNDMPTILARIANSLEALVNKPAVDASSLIASTVPVYDHTAAVVKGAETEPSPATVVAPVTDTATTIPEVKPLYETADFATYSTAIAAYIQSSTDVTERTARMDQMQGILMKFGSSRLKAIPSDKLEELKTELSKIGVVMEG